MSIPLGVKSRPDFSGEFLELVWGVLVRECGAREDGRADFIASVQAHGLTEYRFMGRLGFGGKVRYRRWGGTPKGWLYVDYYPEHRTDDRDGDVQRANAGLRDLL